jgi:hypothetical protein
MHESKPKTIWFYFSIILSIVSVAALLYFAYVFLNKITNHKETTVVVVMLSFVGLIATYSLFQAFKNQYKGVALDTQMDEISKLIPQKPTTWFLMLLPLLLPLLAYIYSLLLTFLVSLVSILFGVLKEETVRIISRGISIVALVSSIGTAVGLWKQVKRTMQSSKTK